MQPRRSHLPRVKRLSPELSPPEPSSQEPLLDGAFTTGAQNLHRRSLGHRSFSQPEPSSEPSRRSSPSTAKAFSSPERNFNKLGAQMIMFYLSLSFLLRFCICIYDSAGGPGGAWNARRACNDFRGRGGVQGGHGTPPLVLLLTVLSNCLLLLLPPLLLPSMSLYRNRVKIYLRRSFNPSEPLLEHRSLHRSLRHTGAFIAGAFAGASLLWLICFDNFALPPELLPEHRSLASPEHQSLYRSLQHTGAFIAGAFAGAFCGQFASTILPYRRSFYRSTGALLHRSTFSGAPLDFIARRSSHSPEPRSTSKAKFILLLSYENLINLGRK